MCSVFEKYCAVKSLTSGYFGTIIGSMAIKPNDCIVKISDLVVGQEEYTDYDGRKRIVDRYETYWSNFCKHIEKLRKEFNWGELRGRGHIDVWSEIENTELAKYGATLKRTKQYKGNYLKFKSHKHFTMFVMRWS